MPNFGEIMFRMNNYCDQMFYVERSTSITDEKMTILKFLVCRGFLLGENNTSCTIALWYGSYTVHGRYRWRHLSNGETLLVYSKLAQSLSRPHCRRKVRLSPKTARQRRNSATAALFCDSLIFLRQSLFSATDIIVALFCDSVDRLLVLTNRQ